MGVAGGSGRTKREFSSQHRAENPADRIETLREVDARRCRVRRAKHRGIGIGHGFQKRESSADAKQGGEERGIDRHGFTSHLSNRNE
jgi:hypothetical protein